jgi:hypothetical protein
MCSLCLVPCTLCPLLCGSVRRALWLCATCSHSPLVSYLHPSQESLASAIRTLGAVSYDRGHRVKHQPDCSLPNHTKPIPLRLTHSMARPHSHRGTRSTLSCSLNSECLTTRIATSSKLPRATDRESRSARMSVSVAATAPTHHQCVDRSATAGR